MPNRQVRARPGAIVMSFSVTPLIAIAVGAVLWAAPAEAALCVDVDLHFAGPGPDHELVTTLKTEAAAIWGPYGVDLHWESAGCAVEDISFDALVTRRLPDAPVDHVVLGRTHVQLTCTDRVPILIDASATEKLLESLPVAELARTMTIFP